MNSFVKPVFLIACVLIQALWVYGAEDDKGNSGAADNAALYRCIFEVSESGKCLYNKWFMIPDLPGTSLGGLVKNGFLDGAVARIYRPENGGLRLVGRGSVGKIFRKTGWIVDGYPEENRIAFVKAGCLQYIDFGKRGRKPRPLTNNRPYYYAVTAVSPDGAESVPSNEVELIPEKEKGSPPQLRIASGKAPKQDKGKNGSPPEPVKELKGAAYHRSALLSWQHDPSADIAGYRVYRALRPLAKRKCVNLQEDWVDVLPGDFAVIEKAFTELDPETLARPVEDAAPNETAVPEGRIDIASSVLRLSDWSRMNEFFRSVPESRRIEVGPGGFSISPSGDKGLPAFFNGLFNGKDPEVIPQPVIECPVTFSQQEWFNLIEYLAAPYDPDKDTRITKPFAALRHTQLGHGKPWTALFARITLRIVNPEPPETCKGLKRKLDPETFERFANFAKKCIIESLCRDEAKDNRLELETANSEQ